MTDAEKLNEIMRHINVNIDLHLSDASVSWLLHKIACIILENDYSNWKREKHEIENLGK